MSSKRKVGDSMSAREMFGRARLNEGRDDLSSLPVPKETKNYARMTSKDVMDQPGGTSKKWTKSLNLRKALTNQKNIKGFPSMDKAGKVAHAFKEERRPEQIVSALLD